MSLVGHLIVTYLHLFRTVFLSGVGNIFMYVLPVLSGLAIYAYYATLGCDPISEGVIDNPNQVTKIMQYLLSHKSKTRSL